MCLKSQFRGKVTNDFTPKLRPTTHFSVCDQLEINVFLSKYCQALV